LKFRYRSKIDRRTAAAMARAFPGRPAVLVTRDQLESRPDADLVPAHLFLWALG
jgi:hypothetical protein